MDVKKVLVTGLRVPLLRTDSEGMPAWFLMYETGGSVKKPSPSPCFTVVAAAGCAAEQAGLTTSAL